jgi:hypothetical protein
VSREISIYPDPETRHLFLKSPNSTSNQGLNNPGGPVHSGPDYQHDNTDDIIYISLEKQHLVFKGSGQSLFVPGGIEIRNVRSGRHTHGEAIGLLDVFPRPVYLGPKDKVVLLCKEQITNVICLDSPRAVPTKFMCDLNPLVLVAVFDGNVGIEPLNIRSANEYISYAIAG